MYDWAIIILLVIIMLLALFILPQLMVARAVPKVIKIFRNHSAIGIKNAKTVQEMGLQPKGLIDKMMKPRDYKPRALELLIHINVVQMTEDGKVYLSDQELMKTRWSNL